MRIGCKKKTFRFHNLIFPIPKDQLIIFMALATGFSRIRTGPLTLHTKTAIHIAELITKVTFNVIEDGATNIIECNGIGLENKFLNK